MMHGPCGSARTYSPCMQNGRCTKYFPKKFVQSTTIDEDGYPIYRRRKDGRTIKKDGIDLDNRFGILLNRLIGNHRVTASFPQSENEEDSSNVDDINMYYDCRFISSCEVSWRILGFPIHYRQPLVERLAFYLKDEQNVIFSDDDLIDDVANRLSFLWKRDAKKWKKKETSVFSIGMIFFVPHRNGELYYLRLLLNVIRGLKKINNHEHTTFRDVCYALSLLDDDKEYIDAIKETSDWKMLSYLTQPFAMLLFSNSMSQLEYVWKLTWKLLSEYILQEERAEMTDDELRNHCLQRLENFLKGCKKGFLNFSAMPQPVYNEQYVDNSNRLILDKLCYNRHSLLVEHQQLVMNLTSEQKLVYDKIMAVVHKDKGGLFFLHGHGGTSKNFIWRTYLLAYDLKKILC
ncbi:hypothetical protein P3S67_012152 [Capsicum chacoense]